MRISAIIPSLYEADGKYLKLCVESLRETTKGSPHQWDIIVVTNSGENIKIQNFIKGITVHLHTQDQGQCNATNKGASIAEGGYLMVVNSDMYFSPGWDKNLSFKYPVFSPNLVEPTNNAGSAPPFLKVDGGLTLAEFKPEVVNEFVQEQLGIHDQNLSEVHKAETGFNLPFFIRKDLWDFLGGYDVAFDPWGSNSDTDLQTRINLAGVTPMRLRDVLVYHFSNKTPTFAPENDAFRMHNFDYFKQKHGFDRDELKSDVWYNKDMLPEDENKIKYEQEKWQT